MKLFCRGILRKYCVVAVYAVCLLVLLLYRPGIVCCQLCICWFIIQKGTGMFLREFCTTVLTCREKGY
jgi:hypothetical protein